MAAIAERVGTSRANAYARLKALTDSGVIRGFSARIDPRRAGLDVSTIVLVSCNQPDWRALSAQLTALEAVEWCALVTGEYDALLLVRTPDVETLRDVVLDQIQALPGVRGTQTMFILDELLDRPYTLPPSDG